MMKKPLAKLLGVLLLLALAPSRADVQDFEFQAPAAADDAGAAAAMHDLAGRILPVYEDADIERYLANLSALQLVAGNYAAASDARQSLRDRRQGAAAGPAVDRAAAFELYARAKALEAGGVPFAQAFAQAFREVVPRLGDQDAYAVTAWLGTPLPILRAAVQRSFDRLRSKSSIDLAEALDLVWTYLPLEAHRGLGPQVDTLAAEDDRRRYLSEDKVLIGTRGGAEIHVHAVRAKSLAVPLPTLLEFSIAPSAADARACAAHGYVGVVAYAGAKRGPAKKGGATVPFEHDGAQARAVIRWIAKQRWSDGRVGMYGDGYGGFAAWAAARRLPPALKAIAAWDAMAPGIDFPAAGGVFRNAAYRWALGNTQAADAASGGDDARWRALDQRWYRSGKPYRDFDRLAGTPSWPFRRWLSHPSYDRYWQKMIPFGDRFARIDIPVLSMTGYYAGDEAGTLYYFTQHRHYRPRADHTLLIGPYDDRAMRDGPLPILRGYPLDSAALVDLRDLRFQWFDHIFKGAARPPLLQDRVNYEAMDANEWRHAPSLEAVANGTLRLYLDDQAPGDRHRLAQTRPSGTGFLQQAIKLADRGDADWSPQTDVVGKDLAVRHGLMFVSEPLQQPLEIDGLLAGQFDFKVNKMDLDLNVALYELPPGGGYVRIFDSYDFRASYVGDRVNRRLLAAGERQQLTFTSERMSSRKLKVGSRLVLALGVNKQPDREINYGTGGDVSEESIADAGIPLKIRWYSDSYIDVPVRR